ncbi:hypothetical protein KKF91_20350 [Myxococcota bacterium]|nr:hypothetical protein [Myxococcota bacterium]MBU1432898.1 hypothetical protein [Myxococcota bacterium]MBU1900140.1 hypothetical protein [Myxococcota bacterium]
MRLSLLLFVLLSVCGLSVAAEPKAAPALDVTAQGEISRAELLKTLDGGPQPFIASIGVAAHLEGGRFVGFKLTHFNPDSPLVNNAFIRRGDVILTVNQEPLERPEQFMRAWEVVRAAQALDVVLLRDGQKRRFRWTITP